METSESSSPESNQDICLNIEPPLETTRQPSLEIMDPKYTMPCTAIVIIGLTLITFGIIVLITTNTSDTNDTIDTKYYSDINFEREDLIEQLHILISSNTKKISYDKIWESFIKTDSHWETDRCKDIEGGISDIFNYKDCFSKNSPHGTCLGTLTREHIWPKSWWECGDSCPEQEAYSDLHLVFPAEAVANNQRSFLPYGMVSENTYSNEYTFIGWKKGPCLYYPERKCIEPPNQWKGVLARATLYVSVRYRNIFKYPCESSSGTCATNIAVEGAHLNQWFEDTLRDWHRKYRVTLAERKRNDAVFELQGNRNPFIDHPEYVDKIVDF